MVLKWKIDEGDNESLWWGNMKLTAMHLDPRRHVATVEWKLLVERGKTPARPELRGRLRDVFMHRTRETVSKSQPATSNTHPAINHPSGFLSALKHINRLQSGRNMSLVLIRLHELHTSGNRLTTQPSSPAVSQLLKSFQEKYKIFKAGLQISKSILNSEKKKF